ncbi:MAG TPA: UDP-N-acetylmuramoyl-L-alanine--D-glutamate ligase, partial [Oscillospiraceae bacterium]|nr:UDP-N-acetylmuramoyl-L-alanine--D-glutamate ligase [Oscillospiraceae bacterium]
MTKAESFFSNLSDKKVAFIGVGVSHTQLIKLFLSKGISVTVCDKKSADSLGKVYEELSALGAQFSLGEDYLNAIYEQEIVFRSPGVYYNLPALKKARAMGIIVTSEMEVFFDLCPCKIYAVTGSDGKTTTTTIISELLKSQGKTVHLGGNIGAALLPTIEQIGEQDTAVVELSSFQLISMRSSPDVAVITNISPNHLDVHGTMTEYIQAKTNLIAHQNAFSQTILNLDNNPTMELEELVRGRLSTFSRRYKPECGAFLREDNMICYNSFGTLTELFTAEDIRIPGVHNIENFLAAISATWGEVEISTIHEVARNFGGVEHRIEFVRELNGVKWYNDSIATSPTRTIAGLESFSRKLIIIAGGYDKKIPFEPLAPKLNERVKTLILLGQTADNIKQAVKSDPSYNPEELDIVDVSTLEEAVDYAHSIAVTGDIISLSPACASFDM